MHFLGIEDAAFIRADIPMTKREIRILTLAKARIAPNSVVADIGAGTGSLSIEAALLANKGRVYAIERKAEGVSLIKRNAEKFGADNVTVIEGEASAALARLPALDAAFIGGSGKKLPEIFAAVDALLKPGGTIVINCVTVETLAGALHMLERQAQYAYEAVQAQITELHKVGAYHMSRAQNPIAIITCLKRETE